MEEIISLIFQGCKLARELESNLPNLANQPNILSKTCNDLIGIFNNVRDRLNSQEMASFSMGHVGFQDVHESRGSEIGAGVQEWLRTAFDVHGGQESKFSLLQGQGSGMEAVGEELRGNREEVQRMDISDSGRGLPLHRMRRRKDEADKHTVRVPAPQMGNTEIPPEDGYTWRKYGQKEILGLRFPRGYYRCTHQKLYQCPAKKQVQRLDNDPYTFEVTYRGHHTCITSSTAPSIPPPLTTTTQPQPPPPATTSFNLGRWLSMDINPTGETTSTSPLFNDPNMQIYRDFRLGSTSGAGPPTTTTTTTGTGGASPSTVRFGREGEYQMVADLADVMFNSGSSSNNSMDLIFSSMEDKWEGGDKKN